MNLGLSPLLTGPAPPGPLNGRSHAPATGQFVTISALLRALRQRRRVWSVTAAAGVLLAVLFSFASPPPYTASTAMLLRHPSGSDPARAMVTDTNLAKSRTVADRARQDLGLDLTTKEFLVTYQVTPLGDEILELKAKGPATPEAVRRANGLARAFLRFRQDEFARQAKVTVDALDARKLALTSDLAAVNDKINAFPSTPDVVGVRVLGDLLAQRASLTDEIAQIRQRVNSALFDPAAVVDNSRVLDPATADPRSTKRVLATNVAAGLVGGLAVGAGGVVIAELLSDRVRRRDDVATLLGAPVGVSVGPLDGRRTRRQGRSGRSRQRRSSAALNMVVRHLRRSVARSGRGPRVEAGPFVDPALLPGLVVASIASDRPAAQAVASLASELVKEGHTVVVVDLLAGSPLGAIFNVPTDTTSLLRRGKGDASLWVTFPGRSPAADIERILPQAGLVLAVASVDPAVGAWHLAEWGTAAVAFVTAGRSTPSALRSTADLLRAAGVELRSVVLIGTDPDDESAGVPGAAAEGWTRPLMPAGPQ